MAILRILALAAILLAAAGGGRPATALAQEPSAGAGEESSTVTVEVELVPSEIIGNRTGSLVVTMTPASGTVTGARLRVGGPEHLGFEPAEQDLPSFRASITRVISIVAESELAAADDHVLVAEVVGAGATGENGEAVLGSAFVKSRYLPTLGLRPYVLLGILGVAVGYVVRMAVGILKSLPRPIPAPPAEASRGRWTDFVRNNYYAVDFVVTLTLSLIVLAALITNGLPPEAARTVYGSFTTGVGLGLLTNSELLTRLR